MPGSSGRTRTTRLLTERPWFLDSEALLPNRSKAQRRLQVADAGRVLPGEALAFAAEVAVGGGVAEHRASELEVADDRRRPEVEDLGDGVLDLGGVDGL